jgi:hypothetical protein
MKKFIPLTTEQIEDRITPCPEESDSMFWREDEIARIQREHWEKYQKRNKKKSLKRKV